MVQKKGTEEFFHSPECVAANADDALCLMVWAIHERTRRQVEAGERTLTDDEKRQQEDFEKKHLPTVVRKYGSEFVQTLLDDPFEEGRQHGRFEALSWLLGMEHGYDCCQDPEPQVLH